MRGCQPGRAAAAICVAVVSALLSGCQSLAVAALGVGGSAAVNHTLTGISYRTFTAPLPEVRTASIVALNRMGIQRAGGQKSAKGETLLAKATDRDIEIELESLSRSSTHMRVVARNGGLFYDNATATEIVLQTEKALVKSRLALSLPPEPS